MNFINTFINFVKNFLVKKEIKSEIKVLERVEVLLLLILAIFTKFSQ